MNVLLRNREWQCDNNYCHSMCLLYFLFFTVVYANISDKELIEAVKVIEAQLTILENSTITRTKPCTMMTTKTARLERTYGK